MGRRGLRGPADRPHRVHGHRAARASAGGQFPAHPGLVRGQQRVCRGRRAGPRQRPGPAVARLGLRRPARRGRRLLHAGARPVPHLGLDHRGRAFRRTLPGVHPDRAGRVDRHHRRDPDRGEGGHRGQRGVFRRRVRRLGRAVVALLRPERRGRCGDDRPLGRPRPAGPVRVPPHPSGDGGGHHRLRGRRREGPGRPRCGREYRLGVDDPGRPGAVPGRARRLQAGGVARPVLAAAGRDRGARPAGPGRPRHPGPSPGHLRRRRGHRRRRQRPPALAASSRRVTPDSQATRRRDPGRPPRHLHLPPMPRQPPAW